MTTFMLAALQIASFADKNAHCHGKLGHMPN
jgi:hypothetical protein